MAGPTSSSITLTHLHEQLHGWADQVYQLCVNKVEVINEGPQAVNSSQAQAHVRVRHQGDQGPVCV